jgi:hypothetical protein
LPKKLTRFQRIKRSLQKRQLRLQKDFEKKHLKTFKWLAKHNIALPDIYSKTTRLLTTGSLAGTLLLSGNIQQAGVLPLPQAQIRGLKAQLTNEELQKLLVEELTPLLPSDIGKLDPETQKKISQILEKYYGFPVKFKYEGNELNYHYGWTGYEQHLYRYPGDSLEQHDAELQAGIAPGLGAWGYFSETKDTMTEIDYLREKFYVAVQTLYLPEWQTDWERIYDWYKYRKVIMVNPKNGKACVAVVGDAGPADWTGKQFGGSPEVMKHLELHDDYQKGLVLLAFVDDPENKVNLGPIRGLYSSELAEKNE